MTGDILIPPSPNWFLSKAIDSRSEDGAMVTASFKSLVVYQMLPEGGLPKILKVIPYNNEKVQLVRLYPDASHNDYGKTIACCGDSPTVKLINFQTGDTLWYHKEHQDSSVNGISWGMFGEEPAVVSVDSKGRMVVWQAKHGVTRVHKFSQVNELTCVEVNPNDQSQAVIGGEKTMLVVELKDGKVLMQFQGHNSDIYCMKWFPGNCSPFSWDSTADSQAEVQPEASSANGKEKNHKGSERDDWRSRPVPSNSNGPFIASSDTGRQIFLWDLSAKRYITKVAVPQSASSQYKKFQGKDKSQGKQHIAITWFNEDLISSTPKGELLSWKLWPGGGRYTVLHHLHSRAIYNVNMIGNAVITSGQDRVIHGYDVVNSSHLFQFPTLGACASTFAFNPHDINRLAIGSQENTIRFINFESEVPLHAHTVWQNIKGKILSISWHPEHEGKLLFGTGSGQVGWVDMSSGRVTTYSYYHQKSVYKVEWAPLMCPEKTRLKDAWCAYSFGDREIVIRSSTDAMADPVQLLPLLSEADNSKPLKDVTEFSFSCDYKYFAVGANDGQVHIYRSSDLKLTVSLAVLRKSIQHLLWQPPTSSSVSYILAIGSNENKVCIFDLSSQLQQKEINDAEILTQATRELCGHESRVVWLSWSPHKTEVLASASYDHTVQLWDTNTGEPLINYGGHINRVFRVEFSPSDPDAMYSFAEENSIHVWKPSQQSCKTPGESLVNSKESRSRKTKEQVPSEEQDKEVSIEKKSGATSVVNEKATSSSTLVVSNKKAAYKSFFPKLHAVCSRKKSFFHMIILHLLALKKKDNAECPSDGKEMEEELGDELEESSGSKEVKEEEECSSINETSKDYGFLLEKDSEMPHAEDLAYALNVYGKPLQMDALLSCEIAEHGNRGNDVQADLMHCWQGSLDDRIRAAARQKKLNSFLVACAPQVSIKLWEFASEAYAEQLVEEGDIISAATYLVNINKVEESINMLLKHRFYREAMAIAKCRLGYSEELVNKITMAWAGSTVFEGAFDFAATLQVSIGQIEEAARTMARRNDHGSLFVASQLYCHAGKKDLSKSIGLLALKEACVKQEHEKIDNFLAHLPDLQWFRVISCCHITLLKLLQQVATDKITPSISSSYYVQKTQMVNGKETTTESRAVGDPTDPTAIEDHHPTEKLPFLQYLREEWSNQGFTNAQYPQLYETITSSLSAQQMPTSVKQLWFLVSVAVCELMMSPTPELRQVHLTTALNYALSWGKADQIYHLTRLLLPRGILDFTTFASNNSDCQDESSKAVSLLRLLHHISELCLLHADLQKDEAWNELTKDFNNDGGESKVSENPVSVGSSEGVMANQEEDVLSKSVKNGTNDNAQDELEVAKENLLKKLQGLELTDEKIYCQPKTPTELLSRLHYHGDFLLKNQDSCDLMEKISESLSEPKKLLLEVTMKLKEKGSLKDEDVQALICKVNSLKT